MFQFAVAVTSIALVTAFALASIFYGGEAFYRAQQKARLEADNRGVTERDGISPWSERGIRWDTSGVF